MTRRSSGHEAEKCLVRPERHSAVHGGFAPYRRHTAAVIRPRRGSLTVQRIGIYVHTRV